MSLSPYLMGPYAPIDEELDAELSVVEGEVPKDLFGTYVRNGPNPKLAPEGRYHWFDGDGMLHAVHASDGRLHYKNRWVRTRGLQEETEAGETLWRGVMEPVKRRDVPYKDTANTDVVFFNGDLLALWYICGEPYRVDPTTLETKGVQDFGGRRTTAISAHAHVDEQTNELMFFTYGRRPPYMQYGVVGADGVQKHLVDVELPGPRLPHDMAITQNYSILMDLPMMFDPQAMKQGRWVTKFDHETPARFGIVKRHGADVRWFEAESCYMYHPVNAWEEDDAIVMIGCRVPDPIPAPRDEDGAWGRMMANLRVTAHLHRWRFDLGTGQVTEEQLDDRNTEFPTIRRERAGRPTRYAFNVSLADTPTLKFDALVKYDLETNDATRLDFGPGRFGSEASFAPRAGGDEDDGYLTTFVTDEREGTSELWIVDAKNMDRGPLTRARIPQRVPLGFHATWIPGEKL